MELSKYWDNYFDGVQSTIEEDFEGNMITLKNAKLFGDPYIKQMEEMGCVLQGSDPKAINFRKAIVWINQKLDEIEAKEGSIIIRPGRSFVCDTPNPSDCDYMYHDTTGYRFIRIGDEPPKGYSEVEGILPPHLFVAMLAYGYFPMGSITRGNTNQSLAQHDLAHMAGFISSPRYMKAVKAAFQKIFKEMKDNQDMRVALEDFDSSYSTRLYYMIEVFIEIPESKHKTLQDLIGYQLTEPMDHQKVKEDFLKRARDNPTAFYRYLNRIYEAFPSLSNCLGGESRDIINRVRKYYRTDVKAQKLSKFHGSSLYFMYQNGMSLLKNVRSCHTDFEHAVEFHAAFVTSLIGTSQLTVEDWVLESANFKISKNSKLYKYINSGMWNNQHLLYNCIVMDAE